MGSSSPQDWITACSLCFPSPYSLPSSFPSFTATWWEKQYAIIVGAGALQILSEDKKCICNIIKEVRPLAGPLINLMVPLIEDQVSLVANVGKMIFKHPLSLWDKCPSELIQWLPLLGNTVLPWPGPSYSAIVLASLRWLIWLRSIPKALLSFSLFLLFLPFCEPLIHTLMWLSVCFAEPPF